MDEDHERIVIIDTARRLLNGTTNSSAPNNVTVIVDSSAVRETLKTYGTAFVVLLLVFCFAQQVTPRLFNVRSWSKHVQCDLALVQYGYFNWMWKVFKVDDDTILDQCGMDTLCFFRMLRFGRKLALVGCLNAIWLIPLYRISEDSPTVAHNLDSITIVNISSSGSNRLVGTVIASYILFLYAMYMILKEFDWFISYRHRFLQKRLARNYAVYVSGIPEEYRSSHKLKAYFRQCCTHHNDVLEAHCTLHIPNLESQCAKRSVLRRQLEHAKALGEMRGTTIRSYNFGRRGFEVVESVRMLQDELSTIEREITTASSRRFRENDHYLSGLHREGARSNLLRDVSIGNESSISLSKNAFDTPKSVPSNEANDLDLDGEKGSDCRRSHDDEDDDDEKRSVCSAAAENLAANGAQHFELGRSRRLGERRSHHSPEEQARPILTAFSTVFNEVQPDKLKHHIQRAGESGVNNVKQAGIQGVQHVIRAGEIGVENVLNITEAGTNIVENAVGTAVTIVVGHEEGVPRAAGFVVFTKLYAVHSALQMIHHQTPTVMEVTEAPSPGDLFWRNVGLTAKAQGVGKYLSLAATTVLCFFWSIPVAFISSLTQVSTIEKSLPILAKWIEVSPGLALFCAQIAPLLLYILNQAILPSLLTEFSKWEGHIASSALEASVFLKMSAFMIIQTFFVSAITGSIASELGNILKDPRSIIDLLANSLPRQSSYFLQIILVGTFTTLAFTMLRFGPLIQAALRSRLGPRLTPEERNMPWMCLHPLSDPPDFQQGQNTAQFITAYMVTFVYATIAPISSYFLLACFTLIESIYRLEFFRNYPIKSDSGGKLWIGFIRVLSVCMVFAQLTLIGFLALKKATAAFPLMVPLVVITILFFIYINDKHFKVASTLPTSTCLERDRLNEAQGLTDFRFVINKYLQPALQSDDERDEENEGGS